MYKKCDDIKIMVLLPYLVIQYLVKTCTQCKTQNIIYCENVFYSILRDATQIRSDVTFYIHNTFDRLHNTTTTKQPAAAAVSQSLTLKTTILIK